MARKLKRGDRVIILLPAPQMQMCFSLLRSQIILDYGCGIGSYTFPIEEARTSEHNHDIIR